MNATDVQACADEIEAESSFHIEVTAKAEAEADGDGVFNCAVDPEQGSAGCCWPSACSA